MTKKRIICFGNSNTWGYDPVKRERYDENTRWPMRMQQILGEAYQVIEEGQNGRTISCEDPWEWGNKKGMDYVLPMAESHTPFDILIIMLGSNELKKKFHLPAGDIAGGLQNMLMVLKGFLEYQCHQPDTKILIVSPVHVGESIETSPFAEFFEGRATVENSKRMAYWYKLVAEQFSCDFFDAALVTEPGEADSIHLTAEGHLKLAAALAEKVREMAED
ncbi:GDSL-type esterase/lipase family protein [Frisingicoccus sp.]|uniref:GDSL-type esterase/lipase family protein n=1 Tax=Frisingicoccus sp. TaxID=1918627 RepID=UPI003AB5FD46